MIPCLHGVGQPSWRGSFTATWARTASMSNVFDVYTIIFLALAVFIFLRLRNVLGQRTGSERPPFDRAARNTVPGAPDPNVVPMPGKVIDQEDYEGTSSMYHIPDIDRFLQSILPELARRGEQAGAPLPPELGLTVADRRAREDDLLRHYLDELQRFLGAERGAGITAPALDVARQGIRRGILHGFYLWGITQKVNPVITTAMLTRLGTAAADHDVYTAV